MDDLPDINEMPLVNLDDLISEAPAALPATQQLLTVSPAVYVEQAFGDVQTEIAGAIATVGMTVHDVDTPEGMAAAKRDKLTFRDLRLAAERLHKDYKAPVLELTRLIDGRLRDIKAELAPYEQHYAQAIEAGEARAAAAERAVIEQEQRRVALIEERIAALRALPGQALNMTADHVETLLIAAQEVIINDVYGEYIEKAEQAKAYAVDALARALAVKRQAEADQAELERLRALHTPAAPPAPPPEPPAAPAAVLAQHAPHPLDVLQHTYRYLVGMDSDVDVLLADVRATLIDAGIALPDAPLHPLA